MIQQNIQTMKRIEAEIFFLKCNNMLKNIVAFLKER